MILSLDASPLLISFATTCAATAATFVLGVLAARFMYGVRGARRGSVRAWIDGILTLPLVLPPTVVGFFLLVLLGRRSVIGHALESIGFTIVFSWPATVIAATVVAFPLMYRTTLGAFEQVNPTLLDAARTLGASEARVFRRVLLPLAAPGVVAGTVLAFARALGEFGATLMLAGNIPGRTQTIPLAIYSAVEGGEPRVAWLWVALIVVLSLAIIRLLNWQGRAKRPPIERARKPGSFSLALALPVQIQGEQNQAGIPAKLAINVTKALEQFNLQVEFVAANGASGLLGASGAGKSMMLRMIAGVVTPDEGRIALGDRVLFDSEVGINLPAAKRKIGVVFQDYALFPHLTVAENVGFGLHSLPQPERDQRVQRQLQSLRIAELADCYPAEISGGERQRTAIARCMAIEPEALLFDEPFAALDPHLRRQTEEQLREALADYKGAVVFVTHDMEEAFRFCADLHVLASGRVIASGPKQQLFEQPRTGTAARLTGCKNIVAARRLSDNRIAVEAWNVELETALSVPETLTHLGFRSHQIAFLPELLSTQNQENVFSCWLAGVSEAPHEMTLYLHLHAEPRPGEKAHLQADVPKELWRRLNALTQPWRIQLNAERLLLLEGE